MSPPLDGSCDPRFASVRTRFAELLADGTETGAAVCVQLGADVVVDLWGGWADTARTRPWARDTIVPTYSVTKAPAAVALLSVVDRGLVGLDEPVESVWPEYGAAGKSATTVRHLLAHRAGLPAFPEPRDDPAAWGDWGDLTAMLARARPEWEPGTAHAEHALTYGHLLGEVVRRVDGRTIGRVWREDLAARLGLDFQIGLTDDEVARVAELEYATPAWPVETGGAPGSLRRAGDRQPRRRAGPGCPRLRRLATVRDPGGQRSRDGARSGRFYAAVAGHLDQPLLSEQLAAELLTPVATGPDALLDREVTWGLGVQFDETYVGMGGLGGSDGLADLRRGYSFGYVTSRLADHDRAVALTDAIEAVLDAT